MRVYLGYLKKWETFRALRLTILLFPAIIKNNKGVTPTRRPEGLLVGGLS